MRLNQSGSVCGSADVILGRWTFTVWKRVPKKPPVVSVALTLTSSCRDKIILERDRKDFE